MERKFSWPWRRRRFKAASVFCRHYARRISIITISSNERSYAKIKSSCRRVVTRLPFMTEFLFYVTSLCNSRRVRTKDNGPPMGSTRAVRLPIFFSSCRKAGSRGGYFYSPCDRTRLSLSQSMFLRKENIIRLNQENRYSICIKPKRLRNAKLIYSSSCGKIKCYTLFF